MPERETSIPLSQVLIEEYRRARDGAPPDAALAPLAPPIPLYQVLVAEYRSQGTTPAIDPPEGDFVERFLLEAAPRIDGRLESAAGAGGLADDAERERRLREEVAEDGLAAFFRFLHANGVRRA